jgi:predicted amidohydrolase
VEGTAERRADTLRAGFVQTVPRFGDLEGNLRRARELAERAPEFDVLVLPELFSTGYAFVDRREAEGLAEELTGPTCSWLRAVASERRGWVVGGFAERAGSRLFNSAALVGPAGEIHVYRKIHLFDREKDLFDAGDAPFAAIPIRTERGTVLVGLMICFDWFFPESARSLALDGAEVLLHPSNLVLDKCQGAMPTRCLENRVFAVTANRSGEDDRGPLRIAFTGRSQITAPDGAVLASAPAEGEATEVVELDLAAARDKHVTAGNDLLADRRPDMYRTAR